MIELFDEEFVWAERRSALIAILKKMLSNAQPLRN
jgi:hypothetical protein